MNLRRIVVGVSLAAVGLAGCGSEPLSRPEAASAALATSSSPAQGSFLASANVVFSGRSGDAPGTRVVATATDGSLVQRACAASVRDDHTWSCSQKLPDGGHTWTAQSGATIPSPAVDFVVRTSGLAAPLLDRVASPTRDPAPVLTGTVKCDLDADDYSVNVVENGQVLCSTGTLESAAWSCRIPPLSEGPHLIAARLVRKCDGATSPRSNLVSIFVKTAIARPTFTPLPTPGKEDQPEFSGTGEIGAVVSVRESGKELCTSAVAASTRWRCAVASPLADGKHVVAATQVDAAGNESQPASISFVVDTHIPAAPTLDAPATPTADPRIGFTGSGEAGNTVYLTDSYQHLLCSARIDPARKWSCVPAAPLDDGDYVLSAVQVTPVGIASGPSVQQPLSVRTLLSPLFDVPRSPTRDPRPELSGSAAPAALLRVLFGETAICDATATLAGRWSCRPWQPLADGAYLLQAQVTDGRGHLSAPSVSRAVLVDTTAPAAPVLDRPASPTRKRRPVLSGSAEARSSIVVADAATGAAVCSAVASSAGSFGCAPEEDLGDGSYAVTAIATDLAGNSSVPAQPMPFRISTAVPPPPSIETPAHGAEIVDSRPLITGRTSPGTTVQVSLDGTIYVAQRDSGGGWMLLPPSALAFGAHHITAVATDGELNASDAAASEFTRVENGVVRGGCSTGGLPWPLFALLAFLLVRPRRRAPLVVALALVPAAARAQQTPSVDVAVFRPASGGDGYAAVEGARPPLQGDPFEVRTWTDFAKDPLVLVSDAGSRRVVVQSRTAEFFGAQAHLIGPLSLAVQLPVTLATRGDLSGLPPSARGPSSLSGGLGDLRITPRFALLRQEWAGIDLATQLSLDLPTARATTLTDDGRVRAEVLLALGRNFGEIGRGRLEVLGNAFVRLRPAHELVDVQTGNEGGLRAGLGYLLSGLPNYVPRRVYGELEGRTFLRSGFAAGSSPAEWRLGATVCPARSLAIDLAGGGALTDGIGAPQARFLLGVGWSPASCTNAVAPVQQQAMVAAVAATPPAPRPERAGPPAPIVIADRDGDGVPDEDDTCPEQAGPAENRGCPLGTRHLVIVSRSKLEIVEQVRFATGKARIEPDSFAVLDQVAEVLRSHPDLLLLRIEGHTDDRGSAFGNLVLSQARADAVAAYLDQKGIARDRLQPVGYGLARPIGSNATAIGRAANRRVAFTILRTRSHSIDAERPTDA